MIKLIEKNPLITISIVTVLMLLPNLNLWQVTIMEARNFITAREMILDENWLLTTMNGEPRYEKPPLPTWLTAWSAMIFGIKNVFAYRFPAALMVAIIGMFTYLLSNKLLNNKLHALYNGLIVITSFYVFGIIIEAPWDIYTHGFMLIGILYLFNSFSSSKLKPLLYSSFFVGCSILSKGPISFYALLLPLIISYAIVYKFNRRSILKTIGVLIAGLIIGGWWFFYVRNVDPEPFIEIATKETSRWSSYNVKPFYYYWSFFIQSGLWTLPAFIGLLYPYLKDKVSNKKVYQFSLLWTLIAVVLLSVIPEKKSRYLMPVLIPLAINTGFYIEYLVRSFKTLKNKKETIPVYFNFSLIGGIGVLFPIIGYFVFKDLFDTMLFSYIIASIGLVTIGGYILSYLYSKKIKSVFYLCVLFFAAVILLVTPLSNKLLLKNLNYKNISSLKSDAQKEGLTIYLLDDMTPEMIWDYGSMISKIASENGKFIFPDQNKFGILSMNENLERNKQISADFKVEKAAVYDLNLISSSSKRHKKRLTNHYYIFERK